MKREFWLDLAKALAIFAVIIDHSYMILYSNQAIQLTTYFSVSLFILAMGYSTYISYNNSVNALYKKVISRIKQIFIPYAIAVFICYIVFYNSFDLVSYFRFLMDFNIAGPYYYVSLYIQLLIISPIIFTLLQYNNRHHITLYLDIVIGIAIFILSHFTSMYTTIGQCYGGGSKLFGGSYLILFYLGMLISKYTPTFQKLGNVLYVCVAIFFFLLSALIVLYMSFIGIHPDVPGLFGPGLNPPGILLMSYSLCIFSILFCLGNIQIQSNILPLHKLSRLFSFIGKHTLYIFLYHHLILTKLDMYLSDIGRLLKCIVYIPIIITLSLCIEKLINTLIIFCKNSYNYSRTQIQNMEK